MLKIGRRKRFLAGALNQASSPGNTSKASQGTTNVVQGRKSRRGFVERKDGKVEAVNVHENLNPTADNKVSAAPSFGSGGGSGGGGSGSSGSSGGLGSPFGNSSAQVDRYNPVHDDLSQGTVAEDWVPRDPRLQNRMFRIMYNRGLIEGPVVETIAEMCWSDFDLAGISDNTILDTYMAAKEAVGVENYFEDITKEYLVIGRVAMQLILDAQQGIWTDMLIHDSDYLEVSPVYRTGYMPKIDLVPSPQMQEWVKSKDPRDIEARQGMSPELLANLGSNTPVPLDPATTAYIPRRSSFNDVMGTSFYVRNIPLWGLEKSLINATLTGHRRRAGPITQIAVGSEQWEPNPEQIDALVAAYTAAEEDSVSSTIGTRYDVQFNQIRGSLAEMWKWSDEFAFLQEAKLKMFGVSEQLIMGDLNIDTTTAPTVFMERLKAHRRYVVESFLQQKFFRALALLHNFRKRTPAELQHRIIVNDEDHDLILPTVVFHRSLDTTADMVRADLLEKMEEKGLPVGLDEWNRTLGGGELTDRMGTAIEDLNFRLEAMKFQSIKQRVLDLQEGASTTEDLDEQVKALQEELKSLDFAPDEEGLDVNKMTRNEKSNANELADGIIESGVDSSRVMAPQDTRVIGSAEHDLMLNRAVGNRDQDTLSRLNKAV